MDALLADAVPLGDLRQRQSRLPKCRHDDAPTRPLALL